MPQFRKKPVVIEAIENEGIWQPILQWLEAASPTGMAFQPGEEPPVTRNDDGSLNIVTLEGVHRGDVGDWIIRGVKGELYPCKPDIFALTYEPANQGNETSSAELASLAGEVLQDPNATEREKRLAGSVLTQFDSH